MLDVQCPVVYQKALPGDYFRLGLKTGFSGFVPGQFGMLEVPPVEGVLLRRPFSLARQLGDVTEILYKAVGKGTRALSRVSEGAELKLLGPLGNGFTQPLKGDLLVGVAGGYGIAPFWEMAAQLKEQGKKLKLFYGARSVADLIYLEELSSLDVELYLSTEDGSEGHKGLVTESLNQKFQEGAPNWVWSCGPMGLLKAVGNWCEGREIPCELSVEEAMGCGTGVCLGCVVLDREGNYLRACVEGPVFNGKTLEFAS